MDLGAGAMHLNTSLFNANKRVIYVPVDTVSRGPATLLCRFNSVSQGRVGQRDVTFVGFALGDIPAGALNLACPPASLTQHEYPLTVEPAPTVFVVQGVLEYLFDKVC